MLAQRRPDGRCRVRLPLPYVLPEINPPIYGTALTLGFVKEKLKEFDLDEKVVLETVRPRQTVTLGAFSVEFIRVAHSIVDGCALAIRSPEGVVIHTGDFKIDQTPVDGELTDLATFARYGEQGVLALMADSTNVEREGYTLSERLVGDAFREIFPACPGRVIVAAFSSNIHRVQQVVDAAAASGRKVLLNGRSMLANVQIARELGYLRIPDDMLIDLKELPRLPKEQVCMVTTGSQGEPMSALTRIAMDDHKQIKLERGDTVILSSRFIPGNEKTISELINHLYRRGAEVYHEKVSEVHVSGHASQEELKLMLNLVRPQWFIPVHGEYRHLVKHAQLAQRVGIPEERCILAEDGDVIGFGEQGGSIIDVVEAGRVFVDGKGVGDVGDVVLKDRRHLSQDGMVVVIIAIDQASGAVPPLIVQWWRAERGDGNYDIYSILGNAVRAPSKMGGEASMRFCQDAIEAAQKKIVDAVVTAPIAKESWKLAGYHFPGHTELFAPLDKKDSHLQFQD